MTDNGTTGPSVGHRLPPVALRATDGKIYDLSSLRAITVVYAYPRTSPPNAAPIEGWDQIPGARGCTPQSCGFRDHFAELTGAGTVHVFGLSTQTTEYQAEVVQRLHLPFPLLSDAELSFARAAGLETFEAGGMILLKRTTLILQDGIVQRIMHPLDDPGRNAQEVIDHLTRHGGC